MHCIMCLCLYVSKVILNGLMDQWDHQSRLVYFFFLTPAQIIITTHYSSRTPACESLCMCLSASIYVCIHMHTYKRAACAFVFLLLFCLTSVTSFPVIKAKGCLATSLLPTVRKDASPLTDLQTNSMLSLSVTNVPCVYEMLCVHDCSCICMERCAFVLANADKSWVTKTRKREKRVGLGKVLCERFLFFLEVIKRMTQ